MLDFDGISSGDFVKGMHSKCVRAIKSKKPVFMCNLGIVESSNIVLYSPLLATYMPNSSVTGIIKFEITLLHNSVSRNVSIVITTSDVVSIM